MKRIAVIGLGLIGGSILKRLIIGRSFANDYELLAYNRSVEVYDDLENVQTFSKIEDVFEASPDLVFICLPMQNLEEVYKIAKSKMSSKTIIADVASVKVFPKELAMKYSIEDNYVGTHPMYGTEKTGWANSKAELGDKAKWAVCPMGSDFAKMQASKVSKFIHEHLYGETVFCDAFEHDQALAISSHLPHVLAYELAGIVSQKSPVYDLVKKLQASSFHGVTRVASSNVTMFEGMLEYNSLPIAEVIEKVSDDLKNLAVSLKSENLNNNRKSKDIHHFIANSDSFRNNSDEVIAPTFRHDADGWVECDCGKEHWGLNGAAGIFLVRFDNQNKVASILLQKRALWSAAGGTWGTPGGAINMNESPVAGALRESKEEADLNPDDLEILGEVVREHGNWRYTTVIAKEKENRTVKPKIMDSESLELQFVNLNEIEDIPLLPAFGSELDELIKTAEKLNRTVL